MQVTYLNVVQDHEDVLPGVVCREDAHGTAHLAARSRRCQQQAETVSRLYDPYRRTVISLTVFGIGIGIGMEQDKQR